MKIKIVSVGKTKQHHWQLAEKEFAQRISFYADLSQVSVKEAPLVSLKNVDLAMRAEAQELTKKIDRREFMVVLHPSGSAMTSETFADFFQQKMSQGQNQIVFVIGGSLGLDRELVQKANLKLSISQMTLPHELAKVVLLEQIYRAFTILRGEKYHK
ncbi:23S rRNA (pseudouridine(1915)-N(3))-methyltransferase RlmH [bacterium]|nr:23S rRNA (pseudouridine(1915)-N(3))-methyltransferase RlmH [bacterium]